MLPPEEVYKLDNQAKATLRELTNSYPEQDNCFRKEADPLLESSKDTSIRVTGEPNSGKRILTLRTIKKYNQHPHIYITSLNRRSINPQMNEFITAGARGAFKITRKDNSLEKARAAIKNALNVAMEKNKKVIVHVDELDFGSGVGQKLESVINLCHGHRNIQIIYTSATPFEIDFAGLNNVRHVDVMPYLKGTDFYGAKNLLDDGNCVNVNRECCWLDRSSSKNPLEFSNGFQNFMREFGGSDSKRAVLRANRKVNDGCGEKTNTRNLILNNRHYFEHWAKQFGVETVKFPAELDDVDWESGDEFNEENEWIDGKILYVVHSTIKRSTDINRKETFFGIYDSPGNSTPISTSIQSILRLNNWKSSPYKVYGDKQAVEVAANKRNPSDVTRDLSGRTGTQVVINPPVEKNTWANWSDFKNYMQKHGFWKNARKPKSNDWKSKIQNGEFVEDNGLKKNGVLSLKYVEKNYLHGIGSGSQKRGSDHRYYICYEDMNDPNSWKIVTVRRRKNGTTNINTEPKTSEKSVYANQ